MGNLKYQYGFSKSEKKNNILAIGKCVDDGNQPNYFSTILKNEDAITESYKICA